MYQKKEDINQLLKNLPVEKKYYKYHTGHIGHLKSIQYKTLMETKADFAVYEAVKGMLPKNSLGRQMFRKLHVYAGPDYEQTAQKPEVYTF